MKPRSAKTALAAMLLVICPQTSLAVDINLVLTDGSLAQLRFEGAPVDISDWPIIRVDRPMRISAYGSCVFIDLQPTEAPLAVPLGNELDWFDFTREASDISAVSGC